MDEGGLAACQKSHLRRRIVDDSGACRDENLSIDRQTFVGVGVEVEYHSEMG